MYTGAAGHGEPRESRDRERSGHRIADGMKEVRKKQVRGRVSAERWAEGRVIDRSSRTEERVMTSILSITLSAY